MSAELLLARLNAKTQSFISLGSGFNALTPLDIAAALAGAPQNAQRTALAAFAGFPEPLLPGLVEARLYRLAKHENWKGWEGTERLRRIARIAVAEYCEPPRCWECEGRAIVYTPQPTNCLSCNGSGYGRLRAAQLCDAIGGVSLNQWKGVVRFQYNRAYAIVSGWGSEALSHLYRRSVEKRGETLASLNIAGEADIDYSVVDGRVRSFELNGRLLFDESRGIEISGWREQLYQLVLDYSLDVDNGRGLHAFVPPIVEEFN